MKKFFGGIQIRITLYDTLPEWVAYRAIRYHTQNLHEVLKHYYRADKVKNLTYSTHPTLGFIPRRSR